MVLPGHKGRSRNVDRATREAFGQKLDRMLSLKGMTRSDLARAIFGTRIDTRGYEVAAGRDRITQYIAGRVWPDPEVFERITETLDCTIADLIPEPKASPADISFERDDKYVRVRAVVSGPPGEMYALIQGLNDMAYDRAAAADAFDRLADMLRAAPSA